MNTVNNPKANKPIADFSQPTVVYDGNCNLCLFWLDVLLKSRPNPPFQLVSITELTHQQKAELQIKKDSDFHSMIYYKSNNLFLKSDAIVEIGRDLGGIWLLLKWLKWIPKSLRDRAYAFIAVNRYRWFGKREPCSHDKCSI